MEGTLTVCLFAGVPAATVPPKALRGTHAALVVTRAFRKLSFQTERFVHTTIIYLYIYIYWNGKRREKLKERSGEAAESTMGSASAFDGGDLMCSLLGVEPESNTSHIYIIIVNCVRIVYVCGGECFGAYIVYRVGAKGFYSSGFHPRFFHRATSPTRSHHGEIIWLKRSTNSGTLSPNVGVLP